MRQKIAEWLTVIAGFRKFIAWVALFVIGIIFRVQNFIDGAQFVDLMKAAFAGFVAGNMTEHIVSFGKEYVANKTQPQASNAPTDPSDDGDKDAVPVVEG